jgi:adenylosuccinate synthase
MSAVKVLVGVQWGDEGKGKWVDYYGKNFDLAVRFQGGNNAGHTLKIGGQNVVFHHLPSGILHKKINVLLSGMVINPVELLDEIELARSHTTLTADQLLISNRCHVITPWHIHLDRLNESRREKPIGTTHKGIGPAYGDRIHRRGLPAGDYVDDRMRLAWIEKAGKEDPEFASFVEANSDAWEKFHDSASLLRPFTGDGESFVRHAISQGKSVLFEGAQGALLDISHGTFPFVTSSHTISGGAVASAGLDPRKITKIVGIAKAYATRVGAGPFPTELKDSMGALLAEKGQEFGATTKRPRRCGWLDLVALKYACDINGCDSLLLNKLDILQGVSELKVAVAYRHPKLGVVDGFPWSCTILEECEPVYETLPGWEEDIVPGSGFKKLPEAARSYVQMIESYLGIPVEAVGCGPARGDFVAARSSNA